MRNFKAPKMLKSLDFIMVEGLKLATDRRTFLHFEGCFLLFYCTCISGCKGFFYIYNFNYTSIP